MTVVTMGSTAATTTAGGKKLERPGVRTHVTPRASRPDPDASAVPFEHGPPKFSPLDDGNRALRTATHYSKSKPEDSRARLLSSKALYHRPQQLVNHHSRDRADEHFMAWTTLSYKPRGMADYLLVTLPWSFPNQSPFTIRRPPKQRPRPTVFCLQYTHGTNSVEYADRCRTPHPHLMTSPPEETILAPVACIPHEFLSRGLEEPGTPVTSPRLQRNFNACMRVGSTNRSPRPMRGNFGRESRAVSSTTKVDPHGPEVGSPQMPNRWMV